MSAGTAQKFKRGDLVHIASDLGPYMSHFDADVDAIVMGSYADLYGSGNTESYSVMFTESGGECSWYKENQLTLIRHVGEDGIAEVKAARKRREAVETDLDWIIENWKDIRENPPGATMAELMRRIGITNPWGSRGEGYVYHANMIATYRLLDPILVKGNRTEIHTLLSVKPKAEPSMSKNKSQGAEAQKKGKP